MILSLFLASCAAPLAMSGGRSECIAGDCENGGGHKVFADGSQYIGDWEQGKFNGMGLKVDEGGFISSGVWLKGKIGRQESSQSVSDSLQLKYPEENLPQFHILLSSSDTPYEGFITEGDENKGEGTFIVQSGERKGNRYEGEFLGEKFHDQGTYTFDDGTKYVGGWKEGTYDDQEPETS